MSNEKPIALVTGGACGIGLACVKSLLKHGFRVAINDLREEDIQRVKSELVKESIAIDTEILAVSADITDSDDVAEMFRKVADKWGAVSALVNNAGISGGRKALNEINDDEWDRLTRINMRGMFLCTKQVMPEMVAHKYGRIVNISSVGGVSGKLLCSAHYAAAKGGIVAFTKRVSMEAAPNNIAINCVAPGLIGNTGFTCKIEGELLEKYLTGIPANRPGSAEEVGELTAFLCSEYAGYIIGQTIVIDGGAAT